MPVNYLPSNCAHKDDISSCFGLFLDLVFLVQVFLRIFLGYGAQTSDIVLSHLKVIYSDYLFLLFKVFYHRRL